MHVRSQIEPPPEQTNSTPTSHPASQEGPLPSVVAQQVLLEQIKGETPTLPPHLAFLAMTGELEPIITPSLVTSVAPQAALAALNAPPHIAGGTGLGVQPWMAPISSDLHPPPATPAELKATAPPEVSNQAGSSSNALTVGDLETAIRTMENLASKIHATFEQLKTTSMNVSTLTTSVEGIAPLKRQVHILEEKADLAYRMVGTAQKAHDDFSKRLEEYKEGMVIQCEKTTAAAQSAGAVLKLLDEVNKKGEAQLTNFETTLAQKFQSCESMLDAKWNSLQKDILQTGCEAFEDMLSSKLKTYEAKMVSSIEAATKTQVKAINDAMDAKLAQFEENISGSIKAAEGVQSSVKGACEEFSKVGEYARDEVTGVLDELRRGRSAIVDDCFARWLDKLKDYSNLERRPQSSISERSAQKRRGIWANDALAILTTNPTPKEQSTADQKTLMTRPKPKDVPTLNPKKPSQMSLKQAEEASTAEPADVGKPPAQAPGPDNEDSSEDVEELVLELNEDDKKLLQESVAEDESPWDESISEEQKQLSAEVAETWARDDLGVRGDSPPASHDAEVEIEGDGTAERVEESQAAKPNGNQEGDQPQETEAKAAEAHDPPENSAEELDEPSDLPDIQSVPQDTIGRNLRRGRSNTLTSATPKNTKQVKRSATTPAEGQTEPKRPKVKTQTKRSTKRY